MRSFNDRPQQAIDSQQSIAHSSRSLTAVDRLHSRRSLTAGDRSQQAIAHSRRSASQQAIGFTAGDRLHDRPEKLFF
ncbi:MAG: hypothetical protein U7126_30955 [Microcoleus sp.]